MASKYGNKITYVDGIRFDSRKEANRYCELKLMEKAGIIHNLKRQVKFPLASKTAAGNGVSYIADFVYTENGKTIVEDVKGYKTDVYKQKKQWVYDKYKILIKET